jgi:hypothetical protein
MSAVDPAAFGELVGSIHDAFIEALGERRDELIMQFAPVAESLRPRLCAKPDPRGRFAPCDRQPGHPDQCTFEVQDTLRRYRQFEEDAALVPALRHQLATTEDSLAAANAELEPIRAKQRAQKQS